MRTLQPLTAFKKAPEPQICPGAFLRVPVRVTKIWRKFVKVFFDYFRTNFDRKFSGTLKTIAGTNFGQIWGSGRFLNAVTVRGRRVRKRRRPEPELQDLAWKSQTSSAQTSAIFLSFSIVASGRFQIGPLVKKQQNRSIDTGESPLVLKSGRPATKKESCAPQTLEFPGNKRKKTATPFFQGSSGTEPEPETGTVGTVFP